MAGCPVAMLSPEVTQSVFVCVQACGRGPVRSRALTNEISRVFLEGSTAAAAGGSALTLTGLFEAY